MSRLSEGSMVVTHNKSYSLTAEIEVPKSGAHGVIIAIGGSIGLSLVTACLFGLSIPSLLHSLKLDPKIAAGPVTLAITDFDALTFYFGIASLVL